MNSLSAQLLVAEIADAVCQLAGSPPSDQPSIADRLLTDGSALVQRER